MYGSGAFELKSLGARLKPIASDKDGIIVGDLERILTTWDTKTQGKKPHILYLVPVGNVSRSRMTMHLYTAECRIRRASYCLQIDTTPYTPCANSTISSCGWARPLGLSWC